MSQDDTTNDLQELLTDMRTTAEQAADEGDHNCANVIESFAEEFEQVLENEWLQMSEMWPNVQKCLL